MLLSVSRKRSLFLVLTLISLLAVVGCSSSSNDEELNKTGSAKLNLNVKSFLAPSAITTQDLELQADKLIVKITNLNNSNDSHTQSRDLTDDQETSFQFKQLTAGESYSLEVAAVEDAAETEYELYSAAVTIDNLRDGHFIKLDSGDFQIAPATGLTVDFNNYPNQSRGKIKLLPSEKETAIDVESNLGRAKVIDELAADSYRMQVIIDGEVVKKALIDLLPGRKTVVTEPIDLSSTEVKLGQLETTTTKAGPALATSNNRKDFIGSQNLELYVSDEVTAAYYTTDGSNPAQADSNRKSFEYGDEITIDSDTTLKLYAKDSNGGESVKSYSYNKVYESAVIAETGTTMPLGALYTPDYTSFRIWSPESNDVELEIDVDGDGTKETKDLNPLTPFETKGLSYENIYHVKINGDLAGQKYQFLIDGQKVRDPYGLMVEYDKALAAGQKGSSTTENDVALTVNTGSDTNIVMDMRDEYNWSSRPELKVKEDAVIYEMHIHDFTIDDSSGVSSSKQGKYLGMVEEGTTIPGTDIATGIDHLKELGVTHVQIMPFYDFATKYNQATEEIYNWGYDPVNYSVPEERYSQHPAEYQKRVNEVKEMIDKFHENGIRVTMDVVYNHSYKKEMFEKISSKYYTTKDLSGTGNSTDTGHKMVSQMMLDSLEYWVEEYNVDGFRFDLMGIFHRAEVKRWAGYLNDKYSERNLLLYGEPWNGGSDPNSELKVRKGNIYELVAEDVGVFNDGIRNGIRGNMNEAGGGFIFNQGSADAVKMGVKGSTANSTPNDPWAKKFAFDPLQTINYMSAHDNLCIGDKLKADGFEIKETTGEAAEEINNLGMGILLTSQGVPFMHGGDEILRYKDDGSEFADEAHNSYMWGTEINDVEWEWKQHNKAVFDYYQALIKLRKNHKAFRLETREEINKYVQSSVVDGRVVMKLDGIAMTEDGLNEDWGDIIVVYNPGADYKYTLPAGSWTKVFAKSGKVEESISSSEVTLKQREMAIFEGEASTADIGLTINGASGAALPEGTVVKISVNGKLAQEMTVDADSSVQIKDVMTGSASLEVEADDYGVKAETITVQKDAANQFIINLEAETTHWQFTFDPAEHQSSLEEAEIAPEDINSAYLIGGMNNWTEADADYQLAKEDNGTWTVTFSKDDIPEGTEFKWFINETYIPGGMGNNRVVKESITGVKGIVK